MKAVMNWSMTLRSFTQMILAEDGCRGARRGVGAHPAAGTAARDTAAACAGRLVRRVGGAGSEELCGGCARVRLGLDATGLLDRLRAILRRHQILDLELLLGAEREQL